MSQRALSAAADLSPYRRDFPILSRMLDGRPLIYLDSAATSLKPQAVIDAMLRFYTQYTANVHRAVHQLSEEATEAFEESRARIARFINAESRDVAFVRNATEAINVVAMSVLQCRDREGAGSGVIVMLPITEHHSNLLPWRGGRVVYLDVRPTGEIDLDAALNQIETQRPSLLALSLVSNALGLRAPVSELTAATRRVGGRVLLDVSQAVGHEPVDVRVLDCDYACFSGHKMLGPSGIGVLYQREGGAALRPMLVGGSMVQHVHADSVEYQPFPWGLEAGTPHIEGVLGLAAACDYLDDVGLERIAAHCRLLAETARSGLRKLPRVRVLGALDQPAESIVAFQVEGVSPHGVARILSNRHGMMVRSGYHCAQPMHEELRLGESVRMSVHLYNTLDEIEAFVRAVELLTRM